MCKETTIKLKCNSYEKPCVNTLKLNKLNKRKLTCGVAIDFVINTGKCPKGTMWSYVIRK